MRVRTNGAGVALGLTVALAMVVPAVTLAAAPALANHCSGEGRIDQRGGDVFGECHGRTPGQPGSGSVDRLWEIHCARVVGEFLDGDEVELYPSDPLTEGDIAYVGFDPTGEYWWWGANCWRDGWVAYSYEFAVEVTPPVPLEVIRDVASARLEPPLPVPETSPPLARQAFVRVPTWLWLDPADWGLLEASETRGLTTVTVWATPTHARWVMGDGGGVTCLGPGVEWVSGLGENGTDCSYTYLHSSYDHPGGRFSAQVTVSWEFEWWINDTYQGVFGTLDLSTPFVVAVGEIQAVETGG